MSDKATLLALAERVEGLDGPDRELGREVLRACGWKQSTHGYFLGPLTGWTSPDRAIYFDDDDFGRGRHDPIASLDAAMTLVPEGWTVGAIAQPDPLKHETQAYALLAENYVDRGLDPWDEFRKTEEGFAATPALALCAAALRARAETLP